MGSGLELRAVQCIRGNRRLFSGLDAHVARGELLRVSGPNGAGKTSLLRMVCGLLTPDHGQVLWQGKPPAALREEFGRQLIYIGHSTATKDDLTSMENLLISARLGGHPVDEQAARTALSDAGLAAQLHVPARFLSQGQRRRLALARLALPSSVALWVLDEPFNALDTTAVQWVCELMSTHTHRGGITVMSSHVDAPLHPAIRQRQITL